MPVLDTGPIDNRREPRTTRLTIRLFNSGRLPVTAGVEVYQVHPAGDGFTNETIYQLRLFSLNPLGQPGSSYTMDNVYANLDVFGVRVVTSGQGGKDIAVTIAEHGADGQVIKEQMLTGEMALIREHWLAISQIFTTVRSRWRTHGRKASYRRSLCLKEAIRWVLQLHLTAHHRHYP